MTSEKTKHLMFSVNVLCVIHETKIYRYERKINLTNENTQIIISVVLIFLVIQKVSSSFNDPFAPINSIDYWKLN